MQCQINGCWNTCTPGPFCLSLELIFFLFDVLKYFDTSNVLIIPHNIEGGQFGRSGLCQLAEQTHSLTNFPCNLFCLCCHQPISRFYCFVHNSRGKVWTCITKAAPSSSCPTVLPHCGTFSNAPIAFKVELWCLFNTYSCLIEVCTSAIRKVPLDWRPWQFFPLSFTQVFALVIVGS